MDEKYAQKEANAIIKEVKKASYKLAYALDNQTWTNYWSNMVNEELKQEKQHRGMAPAETNWTCSQTDAAKLLCCQNIIKYTLGIDSYYPCIDDYLHIKKTHFKAAALAINYTDAIIEALEGVDVEIILNADYCCFN